MPNWIELTAYLDSIPEAFGIPGCDCAIALDGQTVYRHTSGTADLAGLQPLTPRNTYWIYSATKLFTCTAALRLVEQGRISLDDPVGKFLPEFHHLTVRNADGSIRPAKEVLRIRHLFTMTGGLDYNLDRPAVAGLRQAQPSGLTTRQIVGAMAADPLQFEPGSHFLYSLCHDVLAALVEAASGVCFPDFLEREICGPLGMRDTTFYPDQAQLDRLAEPCIYLGEGSGCRLMWRENRFRLSDIYASGGAGLLTTVDDYIRLPAALSCGGTAENGYRVLKPETVALMGTPQLDGVPLQDFKNRSPADRCYSYGLGVRVRTGQDGSAVPPGTFGWDGAAGAYVMVAPRHRLALFYTQQVCQCGAAYQKIHPALRELACKGLTE